MFALSNNTKFYVEYTENDKIGNLPEFSKPSAFRCIMASTYGQYNLV